MALKWLIKSCFAILLWASEFFHHYELDCNHRSRREVGMFHRQCYFQQLTGQLSRTRTHLKSLSIAMLESIPLKFSCELLNAANHRGLGLCLIGRQQAYVSLWGGLAYVYMRGFNACIHVCPCTCPVRMGMYGFRRIPPDEECMTH